MFDKTGTLTLPEPRVDSSAGIAPEILEKAARLGAIEPPPAGDRLANSRASGSPYAGAIEEPGQGVRAVIDGEEARLGSADFCGVSRRAHRGARQRCVLHHLYS